MLTTHQSLNIADSQNQAIDKSIRKANDMDDFKPIRKIISGVSVNTDTAHCFHLDMKMISEQTNGQVKHRRIAQGLYQTPDGTYFLTFWNKPNWDHEALGYDFVDDAVLVDPEQAQQWIRNYCPNKLQGFIASMEENAKPASMQTLTLRLTTELRNHLTFAAKVSDQSLNKLCLNLINTGMSMGATRSLISPPQTQSITMPDGRPALDQFGKALEFEDQDEQALARYAEALYDLWNFNYPGLLPFALHTLYKLTHISRNETHILCFARWLASFHRLTWDDAQDYAQRKQSVWCG